jgi:hypothetical protein
MTENAKAVKKHQEKPAPPKPPCLNPECGKATYIRGLCRSCYGSARNLVKKGRTTWPDLEAKGKVLKKDSLRSSSSKWFLE